MPLKKQASELTRNKFYMLIKEQFAGEYFERWTEAQTVQDREDVYIEYQAFIALVERIDFEASTYDPVQGIG